MKTQEKQSDTNIQEKTRSLEDTRERYKKKQVHYNTDFTFTQQAALLKEVINMLLPAKSQTSGNECISISLLK